MLVHLAQDHELFLVDRVSEGAEVWYRAPAVCKLLCFKNTSETVRRYCKDDTRKFHVGNGAASFYISRKDVMRLIINSSAPVAAEFHEWLITVAEEVFTTGGYIAPNASVQQLSAIGQAVALRLADAANPYRRMWDERAIARIKDFYGTWSAERFWWKWIYSSLSPTDRIKLDEANPINPRTHTREQKVHQWLEENSRDELKDWIRTVSDQLLSASSKTDFETGLNRLLGVNQLELL